MKVLCVVLEDFPGSEARVQRQALALAESGHEVRVICARGQSSEASWNGIKVHRTRVSKVKSGGMRRRLLEYLAFSIESLLLCLSITTSFRPDVVQVANMPDSLVISMLPLRWLRGSRLVFDLHDLMPELYDARGGGYASRVLQAVESIAVHAADRIITVTPMCVDRLRSRYPGERIHLVPNAVDLSNYPSESGKRLAGGPLRVAYVGTVTHRFGVDILCEAVAELLNHGVDLCLDVYGDGDQLASLRAVHRNVSAIRFHGQVPHRQAMQSLTACEVGVVPYRDSDFMRLAFSTKAFEYAGAGLITLLSDIDSLRRQMNNSAALYFAEGSAQSLAIALLGISRMTPEERYEARQSMRRWVTADWSWRAGWSDRYVKILMSLCDE